MPGRWQRQRVRIRRATRSVLPGGGCNRSGLRLNLSGVLKESTEHRRFIRSFVLLRPVPPGTSAFSRLAVPEASHHTLETPSNKEREQPPALQRDTTMARPPRKNKKNELRYRLHKQATTPTQAAAAVCIWSCLIGPEQNKQPDRSTVSPGSP